ncbi:GGDEF domain-containing protein [Gracilibacillus suaedae]|uniref:GGDEF domain-containing protein n=1 Tax=Gracilibacillus suaedae TaxID=2820273 RepID=UPI001ABED1B9|nr:diguanylate cyclase [Gracilibacillus suaedae]
MKAFINKDKLVLLLILLQLITSTFIFYYLSLNGEIGIVLFLLYGSIVVIALLFGVIEGLITSLIVLFIIGSALFFIIFYKSEYNSLYRDIISLEHLVLYGGAVLLGCLIAGYIHKILISFIQERDRLKQNMINLVAIDPDTSFDNAERMAIELKREVSRVNRHGGQFTVLFLEMDYYQEFVKVYGRKELSHLLTSIGEKIEESLRYSDRKFRYSDNKFAFLLIETSKDKVKVVADKIGQELAEHQLLNGKTITLSFHISFEEYNETKQDIDFIGLIGELQEETVFYEL